METISFDEFKRADIRVGTIRYIEPVPDSDKLLRCLVEIGADVATEQYTSPEGTVYPVRQIVSGIRSYYPDYESLVGKTVLYIVNLEPRTIKGVVSNGMLMAVGDNDCVFLEPSKPVAPGSQVH